MTGSLRGVDKDRQLDSSGNENPIAASREGIEMGRVIGGMGGGGELRNIPEGKIN